MTKSRQGWQGWQYQVPVTQCSAGLAGAKARNLRESLRDTGGP